MAVFSHSMDTLLARIKEYREKYYQNLLLKGSIVSAAVLLSAYLLVNTVEYFGRFGTTVRGGLLAVFLAVFVTALYKWVVQPLVHLYGLRKPLSDEEAARQIGQYFPEVGDKLLNTLQLRSLSMAQTDLIQASIQQKAGQLLIVRFSDAIRFEENKKYLKYAVYPLAAIAMILLFNPSFFTSSSDRIINFQKNYTYAPFSFVLQNESLKAFRNEDLTLSLRLEGEALPQAVYLVQNGTRFKLNTTDNRTYDYTFKNIQRGFAFTFEAAGFSSEAYSVQVVERPSMLAFDVTLRYPAYLNKPAESYENVGNLTVPEGTTVEWRFNTASTSALGVRFEGDSVLYKAESRSSDQFQFKRTARRSGQYNVLLQNGETPTPEQIGYYLNVVPDKYPVLTLENLQDTTLYNFLVFGGSISDDYGFSKLQLFYTVRRAGQDKQDPTPKSLPIAFNKAVNTQSFYFQWYVDSLRLAPGDRIDYYAQVWDNDGVNGPKSARSRTINFTVPSKDQLQKDVDKSAEQTSAQMQKALEKAKSLENDLSALEKRLKTNNELDFQEKKQLEDILRKREELMNEIKALQEQNRSTNEKAKQFNQQSPELNQKMEQLQKILDELLNEDSKKLYDEMKKLLEQKQSERLKDRLEKLQNKERNLEKELERSLELFKRLQLEQKMENAIKDLEELAERQEKLAEQTQVNEKNKNAEDKKAKNEELKKEQEAIKEAFEQEKKDLDEMEKMSEELDEPFDSQEQEQQNASDEMDKSRQNLQKQQNQPASEAQKKAAKSMRKMANSLQESMMSSSMEQMQEDIDAMRDILENLLKLSFDQERLMKEFKGVSLQDPRFVKLGQEQLKLQDDAKVIEDSLYALAGRVPQIQSFITRELNDMRGYMDESVLNIKDRRTNIAASKQQFAMTSINNLALMLSDVFKQMQQAMANAMAMPGSGKGKNKGKGQMPGMGEMQQKLNQQMQQLGKGQTPGGMGMSEQLARMAAEQAMIRKMLQELMDSQKGTEFGKQFGDQMQEMIEKMDQTETDLVNKRINQDLLKRQQDIMVRMLETERALKEQGEDEKRKAETARQIERRPPPAFEQYIRDKATQTELLRSIPPTFSPFYKREVDAYFRKYQGASAKE